jgi:hypothetical protein
MQTRYTHQRDVRCDALGYTQRNAQCAVNTVLQCWETLASIRRRRLLRRCDMYIPVIRKTTINRHHVKIKCQPPALMRKMLHTSSCNAKCMRDAQARSTLHNEGGCVCAYTNTACCNSAIATFVFIRRRRRIRALQARY